MKTYVSFTVSEIEMDKIRQLRNKYGLESINRTVIKYLMDLYDKTVLFYE